MFGPRKRDSIGPKFKIGDWVTLEGAGDKLKFRVLGILQDTCSAGTQIHYTCREYIRTAYDKGWYPSSNTKDSLTMHRYNEIELIAYKEKCEAETKGK